MAVSVRSRLILSSFVGILAVAGGGLLLSVPGPTELLGTATELTFLQETAVNGSLYSGLVLLCAGFGLLWVEFITYKDDMAFSETLQARLATSTQAAQLTKTLAAYDSSVMSRQLLLAALDGLEAAAGLASELRASVSTQEQAAQAARSETILVRERSEASRRDGLLSAARTLGQASAQG